MELPILTYVPPVSSADLVRHYHKLRHDFAGPLAESEQIDVGVAFANPDLADVPEANGVVDAALPPDMTAGSALAAAEAFFTERGVEPLRWVMNPSAPPERVTPLVAELIARGYEARASPILALARRTMIATPSVADLMVLPARAAYAHAEALALQSTDGDVNHAAAIVAHLDEPRFDALLALHAGRPVARIGVLAVGDLGLIEQLYVAPAAQGQGIETVLLARALEFCSRSAFKHVLASDGGLLYHGLMERHGFEAVGTFIEHVRPSTHRRAARL
jgi:GNAT superfamily N-acetyltransferase